MNFVNIINKCLIFAALFIYCHHSPATPISCSVVLDDLASSKQESKYPEVFIHSTKSYSEFIESFFEKLPEQSEFYLAIQNKKWQDQVIFAYTHTSDLSLLHFLSRLHDLPPRERDYFIAKVSMVSPHFFLKLISSTTFYGSILSRSGFFELIPYSTFVRSPWYDFNSGEHLKLSKPSQIILETLLKISKLNADLKIKKEILNTPFLRKLIFEHESAVLEIVEHPDILNLFKKISAYLKISNEYWLFLINELRLRSWQLSETQKKLAEATPMDLSLEGPSWALRESYFTSLAENEYFRWKKNPTTNLNPLVQFFILKTLWALKNDSRSEFIKTYFENEQAFSFYFSIQPNLHIDETDIRVRANPFLYTSYLDPMHIEFEGNPNKPIIFSLELNEKVPNMLPLFQMLNFYKIWHEQIQRSSQSLHLEIRNNNNSTVVSIVPPASDINQKEIPFQFLDSHMAFFPKKYQDRLGEILDSQELSEIQETARNLAYRSTLFTVSSPSQRLRQVLGTNTNLPVHGGLAVTYSQSAEEPLPLELEITKFYGSGINKQIQELIGDRSEQNKVAEIGKYAYEGELDLQEYLFLSVATVLKYDPTVKKIIILAPFNNSKIYKTKYGFHDLFQTIDKKLVVMEIATEEFYENINHRITNYLPHYLK